MHWNHRVMQSSEGGETNFSIREVFYDDGGSIQAWTEDAAKLWDESIEGLEKTLERMRACLSKPILIIDPDDRNNLLAK